MGQRARGRQLTAQGLARLKEVIAHWEKENKRRCTQERINQLSGGLDPKTISRILKRKAGTDVDSIRRLFEVFGLELEDSDHDIPLKPEKQAKFDRNFVGREQDIQALKNLAGEGYHIIVIQAKGGVGKTTLAQRFLKTQGFDRLLELRMAKEKQNIASVEGVIEEWLRRDFNEEPGREFYVTLERLRRKLWDPALRIGVLIDNLEPALDSAGRFVAEHRRYVELLKVLGDEEAQSLTLITSRERLQEYSVTVQPYRLRGLTRDAWQLHFEARQVQIEEEALTGIHQVWAGNAKAMEILCSSIAEDYEGNLEAYWEENQDNWLFEQELDDLISSQFERLREQEPDAYKLLCRIGCYRFQNVPTVSLKGLLCLLWDVPEKERKRAVRRLQSRSLIECHMQSNRQSFYLHPTIREKSKECIKRLRLDWVKSNKKIALFFIEDTKSFDNLEEAKKSLEAFHHYKDILEFDNAAKVLMESKAEYEVGIETLGYACWRLGLSQRIEEEIISIKDRVSDSLLKSYLFRVLGYAAHIIGKLDCATEYHQRSGEEALNYFKGSVPIRFSGRYEYKLGCMISAHYTNLGLVQLDTWELENALNNFTKAAQILDCYVSVQCESMVYLGITKAYLDHVDADNCVNNAYQLYKAGSYRLSRWGDVYVPILLGRSFAKLKYIELASEMFNLSLENSKKINYAQAYANSLEGIAIVSRLKRDFESAVEMHSQSISLLEELEAKSDTAIAYFQRCITYGLKGNIDAACKDASQAILLFKEVVAPRQVERVTSYIDSLNPT